MKIFCWDFDGTLATTAHSWKDPVIDVLLGFCDLDESRVRDIKSRMKPEYPWSSPVKEIATLSGEASWEYIARHFYRIFTDCGISPQAASAAARAVRPSICNPGRYRLYGDAVKTLSAVKERGGENVLLTNNYYDLGVIIDALGITTLFEEMIISGVVGCNKPSPEIFELAKRRRPDAEYYMVGDNVNTDIIGAHDAGMKTVLVHRPPSVSADYNFADLYSVAELL